MVYRRTLLLMDVHSKYQKLSAREHVLRRPEMYIGAVVEENHTVWVETGSGSIERQAVKYSDGLLKVVDEVLVNASDNVLEHRSSSTPVTFISIVVNTSAGTIVIENDGPGIPVVVHREHKIWIPEMVFGHLMTGKNFDPQDTSVSAGRHGYGAKLTNIFSSSFTVITKTDGKKFEMTWRDNMAKASTPSVTNEPGPDFTRVEFAPDVEKLGSKSLSRGFVSVLRKRCADLAVCMPDVKFSFNGQKLTSDFNKFIEHHGPTSLVVLECEKHKNPQKIGVAFFDTANPALRGSHLSMVNSVVTHQGGTHLDFTKSLVENAVHMALKRLNPKDPGDFNRNKFFNHVVLFTMVYVNQPKFDSQSKVRLVSSHNWPNFDPAPLVDFLANIPDFQKRFLNSVFKVNTKPLRRSADVRNEVQKVHDAVYAGKGKEPCTLLITEGDSAAALAVGSLSVEQRKVFGVFPVRGKVMNVLTDIRRVSENKEWMDLFVVMGLDPKKPADTPQSLRYQRIVFMTDQDHDGTHIRGLLLAGLHRLFPDLTKIPGFSNIFVTPMVKAFPKNTDEIWFESTAAFEAWKQQHADLALSRPSRYYKGLGTSTTDEGKVYFSKLRDLIRPLIFSDAGVEALQNSFLPDKVDHRRRWLSAGRLALGDFDTPVEPFPSKLKSSGVFTQGFTQPSSIVPLEGFVGVDLLQFALYDNSRMVPSLVDGLKTSGRKIIDGAMQHQRQSMRVSQLAGLISQKMAYHHGEVSLVGTIIGFAQDFVTANNVPLFSAEGQFGSRLVAGGKDHAAARYIFTQLLPITWLIFPKDDLHLLKRIVDDGEQVEPCHFVPIIPMIYVNGIIGITVGHKVEIHPRDPLALIATQRDVIAHKGDMAHLQSSLRLPRFITGYLGTIEEFPSNPSIAVYHGAFERQENTSKGDVVLIRVVELPVGVSAEKYRAQLATLQKDGVIEGYFDYSTTEAIDFDVLAKRDQVEAWEAASGGIHAALKLSKSSVENIVGFGADGRLVEQPTFADVLKEHYDVRLKMYVERREENLKEKKKVYDVARGTLMFVELFHKGVVKTDMLIDSSKLFKVLESHGVPLVEQSYDYLTRMSINRLFKSELPQLRDHATRASEAYNELMRMTPEMIWLKELDALEAAMKIDINERQKRVVDKLNKRRRLGKIVTRPTSSTPGSGATPPSSGLAGPSGDGALPLPSRPKRAKTSRMSAMLQTTATILRPASSSTITVTACAWTSFASLKRHGSSFMLPSRRFALARPTTVAAMFATKFLLLL